MGEAKYFTGMSNPPTVMIKHEKKKKSNQEEMMK